MGLIVAIRRQSLLARRSVGWSFGGSYKLFNYLSTLNDGGSGGGSSGGEMTKPLEITSSS